MPGTRLLNLFCLKYQRFYDHGNHRSPGQGFSDVNIITFPHHHLVNTDNVHRFIQGLQGLAQYLSNIGLKHDDDGKLFLQSKRPQPF